MSGTSGRVSQRRLGIRQGRLLASIDASILVLSQQAKEGTDLLEPDERQRLNDALDQLMGISQRAWSRA